LGRVFSAISVTSASEGVVTQSASSVRVVQRTALAQKVRITVS
jgi:hypothetical protein